MTTIITLFQVCHSIIDLGILFAVCVCVMVCACMMLLCNNNNYYYQDEGSFTLAIIQFYPH